MSVFLLNMLDLLLYFREKKMLRIKPITKNNIHDFSGTSYDKMSIEQKKRMIMGSIDKVHEGSFFEFFVVYDDNKVLGFMSLLAHSKHIISCSPEIKKEFRGKGFGKAAETLALKYAKDKGFTIAVATVNDDNNASISLHEKLGFELAKKYHNKKGLLMRYYIKLL